MLRRPVFVLLLAVFAVVGTAPLFARDDASDLLDKGRELLAGRDYRRAATVLEDVVARYPSSDAAPEALLLAGKAHLFANRPDAAIGVLERLLERGPKVAPVEKVRLLIADAHTMAGRHGAAADLLARRLASIESVEYRRALAEHYLVVARTADEGHEADETLRHGLRVRDFDRALDYYRRARALLVGTPDEARLTHTIARIALDKGDLGATTSELADFFKRFPGYEDRAGVRLIRARAELKSNRPADARKTLRPFVADGGALRGHASRPQALDVIARAWFAEGGEAAAHRGATIARQAIAEKLDADDAATLAFAIGDALLGAGLTTEALDAFRSVLANYEAHPLAPRAQSKIASTLEATGRWEPAREAWRTFVQKYTTDADWSTAQRRIVEIPYARALDLENNDRPDDAIAAYRAFLAEYPAEKQSPAAHFRIGHIEEKAKRFDKALTAYDVVATRYAVIARPLAATALFRRAEILREQKVDLTAAMAAYRDLLSRFAGFPEARRAQAIVTRLSARELRVETERVFRTAEAGALRLQTRNLGTLTIQAYPIDLAEYARLKHAVGRIESVEVRIIKPAVTWTHAVADYEKYRDHTFTVTLDKLRTLAPRGGAFIVAVRGDDLQARTLVVRSDLTVVLKSAPRQALAFVVDRARDAPAKGVAVTFTAGGKVVGRATTGDDGVAIATFDHAVGRVDAFAEREKHVAFTGAPAGKATSFGYRSKAYVYTDRPRYRPGHAVKFKAIARRVVDGVYRSAARRRVDVRVTDSRGAAVYTERTRANEHGSVSGELRLDRDAPLGTYTVRATFDGNAFDATFEVAEYKKPDMYARVTPKVADPLVGERVDATVDVGYFAGGPAKNAAVRWRAYRTPFSFDRSAYQDYAWFFEDRTPKADGDAGELVAQGSATTDDEGRCTIGFDTEQDDRSWRYVVTVEAKGRGRSVAGGSAALFVTTHAYYAIVRADKNAYQPEETIRATVTTVTARHEPVSRTGRVELVREAGAKDVVATMPVTTGSDGRAEVELRAPRGGRYHVRFVGDDRRQGRVTGSATVAVAGDTEDLNKQARILAERETYHIGDTAKLMINSPTAPAWALLTFEGERVFRHRVIRLERRSTVIDAAIHGDDAPNVFARVAIPSARELFEAEDELLVFKFLRVTVKADRADYRPGDEARYTIRATDPSGNPVAAEFSLALVDRSLLAISNETTPAIKPFFYDQKRTRSVNTASSLAFRYRAKTEKIDPDLLGIEARERLEELRKQTREFARSETAKGAVAYSGPAGRVPPNNQPGGSPNAPPSPKPARAMAVGGGAGGKFGGRAGSSRKDRRALGRFAADEEAEESLDADSFVDGHADKKVLDALDPALRTALAEKQVIEADPAVEAALAAVEVRRRFVDTAAWLPHVVTGTDGSATVTVTLPDNLTAWRAQAIGAGGDALVGAGETVSRVSKPLGARLDLPRFLTHGDHARVSAVVNNNTATEAQCATRLDVTGATAHGGARRDTTVGAHDAARLDWDLDASHVGAAVFDVKATTPADGAADGMRAAIPCHAFGIRHRVARAATTTESARLEIRLPDAIVADANRFALRVSPGYDTVLLDGLDYLAYFPYDCVEQTVNRFLPAVAAAAGLRELHAADAARRDRLDEQVRAGLARLYHMQRPDGGWGWWYSPRRGVGPRGQSNAVLTAYALLGLETARRAGFAVDSGVLSRARAHAKSIATRASGYDVRAFALHALAVGKQVDGRDLARAYRFRERLGSAGLARLALAYHAIGAPRQAEALRDALVSRATEKDGRAWWSVGSVPCGALTGSDVETTAWALNALIAGAPKHRLVEPALAYLLANRRGAVFHTTKDTGAALLALTRYIADRGNGSADYSVVVRVNGNDAATLAITGGRVTTGDRTLRLDEALFRPGDNVVELVKHGPGRLHYAFTADTVSPADAVDAKGSLLAIARGYRRYLDPSLEHGVQPGYSVVEPAFRPKQDTREDVRAVVAGETIQVDLALSARETARFVMLEDPIPAGFEVVDDSPAGPFDRFERRDDRAVFFFSEVAGTTRVTYRLRATHPGRYRARAAFAAPMYEPGIWARSASGAIAIHDDASTIDRPEREPTPDELYHGGVAALARGDRATARTQLTRALTFRLKDDVHDDVLAKLVPLTLDVEPKRAVSHFEALQDRNPRRAQFARATRIRLAHAYRTLAEHERAAAAYRDLLRESFEHERAIAKSYIDLGRPVDAQNTLEAILDRYPDANTVVQAWYQRSLDFASIARPTPAGETGPAVVGAPTMKVRAIRELKRFTTYYPESPLADDAHHEVVKLAASLEVHERAVDESHRFLSRFPKSKWADDVTYLAVASLYALGRYDDALATGRPLVDEQIPREDGKRGTMWSPWRDDTTYLFAKIHHIRGDLGRAVEAYRRVSRKFPDAADALRFFTRTEFEAPKTVAFRIGETTRVELALKNVERVRAQVYPVDLGTLFALRKSLVAVNDVDLTGLPPVASLDRSFESLKRYTRETRALDLGVEAAGVYLVVMQAGRESASTVVLVSDLAVEVQRTNQRIRIYVTDRTTGAAVPGALVRVGDGRRIVLEGRTDPRGVFDGAAPRANAAVLVEREGHFAFHQETTR